MLSPLFRATFEGGLLFMAKQHPLSDELVKSWIQEANHNEPMFPQVARFGADWQLDQVIHFLEDNKDLSIETALRFIRPVLRPKQSAL